MKRVFLLTMIVIVCMGGCHKYDHELSIEAPAQDTAQTDEVCAETHYQESLNVKRLEFVQKMHELKRALRVHRVKQRIDTPIIALPARPLNE